MKHQKKHQNRLNVKHQKKHQNRLNENSVKSDSIKSNLMNGICTFSIPTSPDAYMLDNLSLDFGGLDIREIVDILDHLHITIDINQT